MIRHMRHGSPPRLLVLQSILSPSRRESLPTPSAGDRMILDLVVREVVEGLQNQRLEDDDLVPRLASGRSLPLLLRLAPNCAQLSAEILPGHNLVQENQRVLLGIETAISPAEIEEPRLTHSCPSLRNQHAALSSNSCARERSIFRGAHKRRM